LLARALTEPVEELNEFGQEIRSATDRLVQTSLQPA
jgi:hypothetical protein